MTGEPSAPTRVAASPAATVVLLRPGHDGPEVLLTHRPSTMAFAGGMHVFPGGRVDPADADPRLADRSLRTADEAAAVLGGNVPADEALALHHAALRELAEEAGVLLADLETGLESGVPGREARVARAAIQDRLLRGAGLADVLDALGSRVRLRTDRLAPIAHWTTPSFMPRRFSTWFFVADLPPGVEPVFAAGEVASHRWLTPSAALEQQAAGEIEMWVPTTSVLERLTECGPGTAAELGERLQLGPVTPPRILAEDPDHVRFEFGGVGALPGRSGETSLIGRRQLVLVDPGDPSDAALDAIAAAVARRGGRLEAIVLTATDPDHAAAAEAVAIPLGIPIFVAPGAGRRLPYQTREVAGCERLPCDVEAYVVLGRLGSGRLEVVQSARE